MSQEHKDSDQNALSLRLNEFWTNFKQGKVIGYKAMALLLIVIAAVGTTWYILYERRKANRQLWVSLELASTPSDFEEISKNHPNTIQDKLARLQIARNQLGVAGIDNLASSDPGTRSRAIESIEQARESFGKLLEDFKNDPVFKPECFLALAKAEAALVAVPLKEGQLTEFKGSIPKVVEWLDKLSEAAAPGTPWATDSKAFADSIRDPNSTGAHEFFRVQQALFKAAPEMGGDPLFPGFPKSPITTPPGVPEPKLPSLVPGVTPGGPISPVPPGPKPPEPPPANTPPKTSAEPNATPPMPPGPMAPMKTPDPTPGPMAPMKTPDPTPGPMAPMKTPEPTPPGPKAPMKTPEPTPPGPGPKAPTPPAPPGGMSRVFEFPGVDGTSYISAHRAVEDKEVKVEGIMIDKKDDWITVKADGEDEAVKYVLGKNADKKLQEAFKTTFNASRVQLTFKKDGDTRQLTSIKRQILKKEGTMTGTVVKVYNEFWVEVKPKEGVNEAFAPGVNYKDKEFMATLKGLKPGDSVTIKYNTDFERHRILSMQVNEKK